MKTLPDSPARLKWMLEEIDKTIKSVEGWATENVARGTRWLDANKQFTQGEITHEELAFERLQYDRPWPEKYVPTHEIGTYLEDGAEPRLVQKMRDHCSRRPKEEPNQDYIAWLEECSKHDWRGYHLALEILEPYSQLRSRILEKLDGMTRKRRGRSGNDPAERFAEVIKLYKHERGEITLPTKEYTALRKRARNWLDRDWNKNYQDGGGKWRDELSSEQRVELCKMRDEILSVRSTD